MKRAVAVVLFGLLLGAPAATVRGEEASATEPTGEEAGAGLSASLDVVGKYVWRGYDLSHGDPNSMLFVTFAPSFAPGLSLSTGLYCGLRTDEAKGDPHTQIDEWDLSGSWEIPLAEHLSASVGLLYYDYRGDWTQHVAYLDDYDTETSLTLKLSGLSGFDAAVTWYHGLDDKIAGDYLELVASRAFPLGGGFSFAPKLSAGWSTQYDADHEWTNVTTVLPLTWNGPGFTVTPSFNWSYVFDPGMMNKDDTHNLVWAGINFSASF